MKNLLACAVLYLMISLLACQEPKEKPGGNTIDLSQYKNIGTEISVETADRWMQAYRDHGKSGRWLLDNYYMSASQLQSLMQSVSDLTGIAFHHAIDEVGRHRFIAIAIDESLSVWSPIPNRKYIDCKTNSEISQAQAAAWCQNYKNENPNEIWFHFFGSGIFDEIISIPYFDTLDIEPALNDLNLLPQLLLIITDNNLLSTGRIADDQKKVYDASSPCPPCAVQ
jgi:hypothetical protein